MNARTACLALVTCVGCLDADRGASDTPRLGPSEMVVARAARDLDGDAAPDSLLFVRDTAAAGPERYSRIELKLTRTGWHAWRGDGDSALAPPRAPSTSSIADLLYVRPGAGGGTILTRIGPRFSCCDPSLSIGVADAAGFRESLHFEQFTELNTREWDAAGISRLIGAPCNSEPVAGGFSYRPTLVVILDTLARIDTLESVRQTTEDQGGFDGLACGSEAVSVRTAGGRYTLRLQ